MARLAVPATSQPMAADAEPFFLVGAIRSGTTLLRLMLGHHSKICRCHEMEYVASAIAGRADWPDVSSYARELPGHHDFRVAGFVPDASLPFPELVHDLFTQLRAQDGKELAGATVHNHFDELTRLWPNARFIHLERDPRDVARSCVVTGWAAGNVWAAADIWIAADDAWRRLEARVPESRRIEVRFEGLVAQPEVELERLCRFLGVSYEPGMLDLERDTTYRRPSKRDARSWRDDAPPLEVRIMEARFGPRLARAGYAPSGLPPLPISRARTALFRLDHRWRRMRASQGRYGFWLWAASTVSRRLERFRIGREARERVRAAMGRIDESRMR